jgi:16S rRNA processing protein RimM
LVEKDGTRSRRESKRAALQESIFAKLSGVDRIDDAEPWSVHSLSSGTDLDPLISGEYYHYQVIGLEVFDTKGERIGIVARTWATPGGELYVVNGAFKEHLIPAVKEIIEKVDFAAGKMVINLPEGLLDL